MKKTTKYVVYLSIFLLVPAVYYIMQKDGATVKDDASASMIENNEALTDISLQEGEAGVDLIMDDSEDHSSLHPPLPDDPWELMLGSHLNEKLLTVSSGDTLINILLDAGLATPDAYQAVNSVKDVFDPRKLRKGQALHLTFDDGDGELDPVFKGLRIKLNVDREVQLINCTEDGFKSREFNLDLEIRHVSASAQIDSSLYQTAIDAKLPIDILMQMIRAYSYAIDFQRDIQPGDSIEVLYEEKVDQEGVVLKSGEVLYASLHTRGKALPIYRHATKDGENDFFDADGKSVRRTLMVTPIDGARISSGYGMRRHPIQGYNRMHQGLDFAAPTGTPIMAAGAGIVERASRYGSYGHYIRIRHANEYHTAYAHLSRYARGIRSGVRVKQGQVIGYVGSTGVSTGPHLHYEVLHRGKQVNPSRVKTPPGRTLAGDELKRFQTAKAGLQKLYASIKDASTLADASGTSTDKDKSDS